MCTWRQTENEAFYAWLIQLIETFVCNCIHHSLHLLLSCWQSVYMNIFIFGKIPLTDIRFIMSMSSEVTVEYSSCLFILFFKFYFIISFFFFFEEEYQEMPVSHWGPVSCILNVWWNIWCLCSIFSFSIGNITTVLYGSNRVVSGECGTTPSENSLNLPLSQATSTAHPPLTKVSHSEISTPSRRDLQ